MEIDFWLSNMYFTTYSNLVVIEEPGKDFTFMFNSVSISSEHKVSGSVGFPPELEKCQPAKPID